jgi:hypothetical protein
LNGDSQAALIDRSKKLRALWLANGVKEPIKQNFLDEIEETSITEDESPSSVVV